MYSERYVFLNSQYIYLKTILEYSKYSLLRIVPLPFEEGERGRGF